MAKKTKPEDKNSELENQLKRALADYANLQKRIEDEKKTLIGFANAVLLAKFLDVLDNLEAAQKNIGSEGLDLVVKKFKDVLASEGVKEIPAEGDFNPHLHEGIATVEGEKDDQIAEVLQKGYFLGERVLRPARVKVTRARKEEQG